MVGLHCVYRRPFSSSQRPGGAGLHNRGNCGNLVAFREILFLVSSPRHDTDHIWVPGFTDHRGALESHDPQDAIGRYALGIGLFSFTEKKCWELKKQHGRYIMLKFWPVFLPAVTSIYRINCFLIFFPLGWPRCAPPADETRVANVTALKGAKSEPRRLETQGLAPNPTLILR